MGADGGGTGDAIKDRAAITERREDLHRQMFREANVKTIDQLKLKRNERQLQITNIHYHIWEAAKRACEKWNP